VSGFTPVPNWLVREPRLTPAEFRILVYIAMYSKAYPTKWQIMDATGLSRKLVYQTLESLKALNVIAWIKGTRTKATEYWIVPIELWRLEGREERVGMGEREREKHERRARK